MIKLWLLLILFGCTAFADDTLIADLHDLPDDLKAQVQGLDDNQRAYLIQMLSENWPGDLLIQGTTIVFDRCVSVGQVVSGVAFIGEYKIGTSMWVTGISTDSITDDSVVDTDGFAFLVSGTERYATAIGGSNTVVKLQAFSTEAADDIIQSLLMRRGYRLFRFEKLSRFDEDRPWKMYHVSSVSRTSAEVTSLGEKRSGRVQAKYFSQEAQQWLINKDNISAMKKAKREWDAR